MHIDMKNSTKIMEVMLLTKVELYERVEISEVLIELFPRHSFLCRGAV
jgi:hypothetical protein